MKKVLAIIAAVAIATSINAQDYYIGGGLDASFIVYPDGTSDESAELVLCGQYDDLDVMLGIGLHEKVSYTNQYTFGIYAGRNINRFSIGGYLGYDLMDTKSYYYGYYQEDMLLFGVYAKFSLFEHVKLFTFYKFGYDNNSRSKWNDRGFGFGVTIGFSHSDKTYSTGYYYN